MAFFKGILIFGTVFYLFYESPIMVIPLSMICAMINIKFEKKKRTASEKDRLTYEFEDALSSIVSALSAGYSLENSFREAGKELELIYGKRSALKPYIDRVVKNTSLNIPPEETFAGIAAELDIEEINSFSEILNIVRVSGGNLIGITRKTVEKLSQRIEVLKEINTIIAAKRMEMKIMNVIPLFMIAYLKLCSPGFLDVMYTTVKGRLIMTAMLCLYICAYAMSTKITDIQV